MIAPAMSSPAVLVGVPAVLVCGAAALMWWRKKNSDKEPPAESAPAAASPPPAAADPNEIHAFFREANTKLKASPRLKGSTVATLPVVVMIGPAGSGKTTAILQSGMQPELLAGQVFQGSQLLPTRGLNIWLARDTVFVEIPSSLASDENAAHAILKNLQPGRFQAALQSTQPPRALLLCVEYAPVISARTPEDVTALARPWNRILALSAATLGAQLPCYVLFTRTDSMNGFQEFVSNLAANDLAQAFGATVQPFNKSAQGVYGEETSRVLTRDFLGLVYSISDCRVPLLTREADRARLPGAYQFPREFGKAEKSLVQFLVDVARPSQLQANAFLRGFYFSGTRKVVVERPESSGLLAAAPPGNVGATSVISPEQLKAMMAAALPSEPANSGREVSEWLFLPALFERVILQDPSARIASAGSSRTDRIRAAFLIAAGILGIAWFSALTISYVRNRHLEADLTHGAEGLSQASSPQDQFIRLNRLRQPVQRLLEYRSGPPWSMRWGLYQGETLIGPAQTSYCSAVRTRLLPPLLQQMSTRLASVRKPGADHTADFNYLKAYMMVTTYPQKAEETFLSQQLLAIWKDVSGSAAPDAAQLLPAEFGLYGALLPVADAQSSCVTQPAPGVIPDAQQYLRSLNANDRYQSLLQQAGRGLEPVSYAKLFPNGAVTDATIVPSWFTRQGWAKMQDLLQHPEESLKADAWVLGESKDLSSQELSGLASEYRARYFNDYVNAWKGFLASAKVTPYSNAGDAVAKLEKMSGQHSVLISLIALASEHTSSIDKVKTAFQPASMVAADPSQYVEQLSAFKNRIARFAQDTGPSQDQDLSDVRGAATTAEDTVDKMALKFKGDTDQITKEILLKPITQYDARPDPRQANGGGQDLCRAYDHLSHLLPFSGAQQGAAVDDVQQIFQPEKGRMWQLYDQALRDSLDCSDSGCSLKSNPKFQMSKGFLEFFNGLNRWSRLLYGGSQDMMVRLQLRATTDNYLSKIEVVLGDQRLTLPAGGEFQSISWNPRRTPQRLQVTGTFEEEPQPQVLFGSDGPWALFDWFWNAERGSGGAQGFTWKPRAGLTKLIQLRNGRTETYRIEIRYGDGTARPLDLRSLSPGACALPVAK